VQEQVSELDPVLESERVSAQVQEPAPVSHYLLRANFRLRSRHRLIQIRTLRAATRELEQLHEHVATTFSSLGFREDLYYRVNAFSIRLPSLRERQVDIPVLANRFLARYCAANGLPLDAKSFAREALDMLTSYHWPGNIRELESTVSRAALSAPGRSIRAADIEFLHAAEPPVEETGERLPSLREAERAHIVRILDACSWNKKEAARILEISRGTLYRKILEFGLEPQAHSSAARNRPRRLNVG
jgi:DNA-binding NtrC family response regulator